MQLKLEENLLLGQIIGLINGLYDDPRLFEIEDVVRKSLTAIKENQDLSEYRDLLIDTKKKFLNKCVTCSNSCGKSDDYQLNGISDDENRDIKITQFTKFLDLYDDKLDFQTIANELVMYRWW